MYETFTPSEGINFRESNHLSKVYIVFAEARIKHVTIQSLGS